MSKNRVFQYYVEGEDEEKLVSVLKSDLLLIQPGKIQVFNVIHKGITNNRLRLLNPNTSVVLIFDTDVKKITSNQNVKEVICIPQVENIEDELKRSCNVRKAWDILGSTSRSEFKKDIITEKNLAQKLKQKNFAIDKIWILNPSGIFEKYSSEGFRVKY